MKFKIVGVLIKEIRIDDTFFKITTNTSVEHIAASIKQVGLLSYPYLIRKGDDSYRIISGFRRITACETVGYRTIMSKVVCDKTSQFDCVKLAIADNAFQRKLNILETSRCYHLLMTNIDVLGCRIDLSLSLGLELSPSAIKKIEPICSLPLHLQEGIAKGFLSLPVALKLGDMEDNEASIFVIIFRELNTTLNNQREIIELITDICNRDGISLAVFYSSKRVKEIFFSDITSSQKTNRLRLYLKKLRYPTINLAIDKFNRKLKELQFHNRVKLKPLNFFEGNSYSLNIVFDDSDELKKYKEDLDKIINDPTLLNLS